MKRYLTFLLDLSSQAENKAIAKSVRYAPDASSVPRPFVWKIVRDANDRVFVFAHGVGWSKPIATAEWKETGIHERRQHDPSEPNGNQWLWIHRALVVEGSTPAALASSCDVVEDAPRFKHEPAVEPSDQATRRTRPAPVSNKKAAREFLTYLAVVGACAAVVVALKRTCAGDQEPERASPPPAVAVKPIPPEPVREAPVAQTPVAQTPVAQTPEPALAVETRVAQAATFADALALARPAMADSRDEVPAGAALLARYTKLRWADVEVDETTVAKVQKDSEAERGKRLCTEGTIERITRRDIERRKVFIGRLVLPDGDALAFVVVGTTGELVKRDRAKLCGVVTGTAGNDVAVVGMFDLPENRTPQVEQ